MLFLRDKWQGFIIPIICYCLYERYWNGENEEPYSSDDDDEFEYLDGILAKSDCRLYEWFCAIYQKRLLENWHWNESSVYFCIRTIFNFFLERARVACQLQFCVLKLGQKTQSCCLCYKFISWRFAYLQQGWRRITLYFSQCNPETYAVNGHMRN